jgi:predicted signal transduction protein with EAL and GGDEF domain
MLGYTAEEIGNDVAAWFAMVHPEREITARRVSIGYALWDGYSSFRYLRALHFDSLKIDRPSIARLISDPETHAIVRAIIKLAHTLDITVVAEGRSVLDEADAFPPQLF